MKEVSDIVLFFGRFHPLVVHLPIGFLFFAFILELFVKFKNETKYNATISLALFLGIISALTACILGYMLSLSGDYDETAADDHFWFGIATTVVALITWVVKTDKIKISKSKHLPIVSFTIMTLLLTVTGHYGGNLTHGEDYLTAYLPFGEKEKEEVVEIKSIEEAKVYAHVVAPIFKKKCISCHNSNKKKGGLSLEGIKAILKGGKNGAVLLASNNIESPLLQRILLDPSDKEAMPPKGKAIMTKDEIKLVTYWIDNGNASFEVPVSNIETSEEMKILITEQLGLSGKSSETILSVAAEVPSETLLELTNMGVKVRELVAETNQFEVSIVSSGKVKLTKEKVNQILQKLSTIKNNIIRLSIPNNEINDNHLKTLADFNQLRRLNLEKNEISDDGVSHLLNLENLKSINLHSNRAITSKSAETLIKMKSINSIYLWRTSVKKEDVSSDKIKL